MYGLAQPHDPGQLAPAHAFVFLGACVIVAS